VISVLLVDAEPGAVPGALLPYAGGTVLDESMQRLERLGARVSLVVATQPGEQVRALVSGRAEVADASDLASALHLVGDALSDADTDVALVAGDLVLPDEAAAELLLDPRRRTSAAVGPMAAHDQPNIRRRSGQVVSAGSANHRVSRADATFAGALLVARSDLIAAAGAVRAMADVAQRESWNGDVLEHVLVALVRQLVPVSAVDLGPWPWRRPETAAQIEEVAEVMNRTELGAVRLTRAARADDGFYATFVLRRISRRVTPLALRWGLSPNQITVVSLGIGLAAALAFATGSRAGLLTGAVLLQCSMVLDCVDGEVARYNRAFSSLGAWLDSSTDRVKEYACYAGLAVGADDRGVWLLAAAMLTLQTVRHTTDYTFTLVMTVREGALQAVDLYRADDIAAQSDASESAAVRAVRASELSNNTRWVHWTKKALHMSIGERWFVISAVAAVGTARWVFVTLIGLALVALAYTTVGRVVRARSWPELTWTDRERDVVRAQLDRGPLAQLASSASPWSLPVGRYAWFLPPLLRLTEYATMLLVVWAVAPDAIPAAFALLFALAYHHYDALYRVLNGLPPDGVAHVLGLGVEGRLIVVLVLAALGDEALSGGLVVLAAALGGLFLVVGVLGGVRALRPRADAPVPPESVRA